MRQAHLFKVVSIVGLEVGRHGLCARSLDKFVGHVVMAVRFRRLPSQLRGGVAKRMAGAVLRNLAGRWKVCDHQNLEGYSLQSS